MTKQEKSIKILVKNGFKVVHSHYELCNPDVVIYHLSKKRKTGSDHATIEGDGNVNGQSIEDFLLTIGL